MANTLVGLFDDRDAAQGAVNDLVAAGVDRADISVVANDASGVSETSVVDTDGNLAAEGASAGLSSGAVVGGIAGLLIGAGFTFLPIAGFLLAGPIAGLIAGAAAGAATGGVVGGLIGLGIPEEHAGWYAEGVRRGGTLVTVKTDVANEDRLRSILDRDGAVDIERRSADWRESGFTGYDPSSKPFTEAETTAERTRYGTPINSDWNDTANAPAPSADGTYAERAVGASFGSDAPGSTYGTTASMDDAAISNVPSSEFDRSRVRTYGDQQFDADWDQKYRTHFANYNPGGNYDDYAPAYRYGNDLANDPTYTGDWDANESAYRTRWEERNPGTWEQFKASVRHGWDEAKNFVTGGKDDNRATLY